MPAVEMSSGELPLASLFQLLDMARDAMVVHWLDRRVRYWSLGAQQMFGYSPEAAVGRTIDELLGAGAGLSAHATNARPWPPSTASSLPAGPPRGRV